MHNEETGAMAYADLFITATAAVAGRETSIAELRVWGERAVNLYKILNVRAGFSRKDDKFPKRWFEPVFVEGKEVMLQDYFENPLTSQDCERLLDDYYDERGWNVKKGIPQKDTLERLGLGDIADNLESNGFI